MKTQEDPQFWVCLICHGSFSQALDIDPGDIKSRFRRAQALQKLGRLDQAFLDAQKCAQLEPKNKAFQDLLRQLGAHIQQKVGRFSDVISYSLMSFKSVYVAHLCVGHERRNFEIWK